MLIEMTLPKKIRDSFAEKKIELFYYDTLDSTNKRARAYAAEKKPREAVLIVAERQSAGRGRLGKSFYSPEGTGLYMTLLLPAPKEELFTRLTALCAVATRKAIIDIFGAQTSIKWVNDLYLAGRKVAGILAESFAVGEERYVALGVGVNICTQEFPSELSAIAGSLNRKAESREEARGDSLALAFSVCNELMTALTSGNMGEYMDIYRRASCVIDRDISFFENGEEKQGRAVDINDRGELIVKTADGTRALCGGEISVRVR